AVERLILPIEQSPFDERNVHRLKVTGTGDSVVSFGQVTLGDVAPLDDDGAGGVGTASRDVARKERHPANSCHSGRSRQRFESLFNLLIKIGAARRLRILCRWQRELQRQYVFGVKAGVDIEQARETLDEQRRARE